MKLPEHLQKITDQIFHLIRVRDKLYEQIFFDDYKIYCGLKLHIRKRNCNDSIFIVQAEGCIKQEYGNYYYLVDERFNLHKHQKDSSNFPIEYLLGKILMELI